MAAVSIPKLRSPPNRKIHGAVHGILVGSVASPAVLVSLLVALGAPMERWYGVASFVGLVGLFLYYARAQANVKRGRRLDLTNAQAIRLLEDDPATAMNEFAALVRQSRGLPLHHSIFLMNFGVALQRLGEPARAVRIHAAIHRAGWLTGGPFELTLLSSLSTAAVLAGDLSKARRWLKMAETRAPMTKRALLVLSQALLAARAGQFDDCVRTVNDGWNEAYRVLNTETLTLLSLLRAFAASRRDPEGAARAIEELKKIKRRTFAHWTTHWPEFEEFVRENQIGV